MELYVSDFLVLTTGENNEGYIPKVLGLEKFKGEIIHSSEYKSGEKYQGKNVLVVGSGNSGMEISFDLSNYGSHTSIVVRSPVLPGISEIKEHTVVFANGEEHQFDAIVFATGYKNVATKWLKDYSSIFHDDGTLINKFPNHYKGENGLYCAGFSKRGIAGISMDAIAIADNIKTVRGEKI